MRAIHLPPFQAGNIYQLQLSAEKIKCQFYVSAFTFTQGDLFYIYPLPGLATRATFQESLTDQELNCFVFLHKELGCFAVDTVTKMIDVSETTAPSRQTRDSAEWGGRVAHIYEVWRRLGGKSALH